MEILILAIYAAIVWLVFFKLKWLPWNFVSQVIVVTLPIVGLTVTILWLNVVAPSSHDVRVVNYVVQIVPQVSGQIVDVPVRDNQHVSRGDVVFRIDSVPFALKVRQLEAELENTRGQIGQTRKELDAVRANTTSLRTRLELAQRRQQQNQELVQKGAGDRFALEDAETEARDLQAKIAAAVAEEARVNARLGAASGGEQAEIAETRAKLAQARWELEKTTYRAPGDGWAINVQVRPGTYTAAIPLRPVMTLVQSDQQVYALFKQNELSKVEKGNEAEITLTTLPGKIIKTRVANVIWAQGQGQVTPSGDLPRTTAELPPGRFAVELDPEDSTVFLAAGARGAGAIYTEHGKMIHLIRKVIVRVGAKLDYLILKLH
jgi:multidrug resistance efflux pump